jgi:hypothetical protein
MKKEKVTQEFAKKAVGALVAATGYPAMPKALVSAGIDRSMLRAMERKGLLKSIKVGIKGQCICGYYTEDSQPVKFFEKIERDKLERAQLKEEQERIAQVEKEKAHVKDKEAQPE